MNRLAPLLFVLFASLPACGEGSGDAAGGSGGEGGEGGGSSLPISTPGEACTEGAAHKSPCTQTQQQACTEAGTWSACIECQFGLLDECDDGQIHCYDAGLSPCEPQPAFSPGSDCTDPTESASCGAGATQICLSSGVWSDCIPCATAVPYECPNGDIECIDGMGPMCNE